ncbi:MAG: cytochrome c biogenesis protein ResB [Phycisphaerae bacterium]|nr:cytochrome c biogenesis protein ResB [Phycisphaerae bacterium]
MNRFRRAVLWAVLAAIVLLTGLSIYGAFIGADRAQAFFTSVPLAGYWFAAVALLVVGIALFRRLLRVPSLLLMHTGCILIVLGMMWGSKPGHALQKRLFGIDKIPVSELWLYEGVDENRVLVTDVNNLRELPFFVRLNDFRIEYYEPGQLWLYSRDERNWRMPAEAGQSLFLDEELGTVTIRRVFKNFKIDIKADEPVAYDEPNGSNPALEVTIERPGAKPGRRYVFERRPGHTNPNDPLAMVYRRIVKDYISELEIVQDGEVVASKNIEVNHPLYYGGYHIYQNKPGGEDEFGTFTGLLVVSASGLNAIYGGYVLLTGGIFWHFWGRRILDRIKTQNTSLAGSQ